MFTSQVSYALGALYYLCNPSTEEEILKPEVVEVIEKFADAGAVNVSFRNLARTFLDKHVTKLDWDKQESLGYASEPFLAECMYSCDSI